MISASCDSCNKKHDETLTDETTTVYTETPTDTAITADTEAAVPATEVTSNRPDRAKGAKNTTAVKDKTDKSKDGYSAEDGTDAENKDGDQYTKNVEKPMPSGPPIK